MSTADPHQNYKLATRGGIDFYDSQKKAELDGRRVRTEPLRTDLARQEDITEIIASPNLLSISKTEENFELGDLQQLLEKAYNDACDSIAENKGVRACKSVFGDVYVVVSELKQSVTLASYFAIRDPTSISVGTNPENLKPGTYEYFLVSLPIAFTVVPCEPVDNETPQDT